MSADTEMEDLLLAAGRKVAVVEEQNQALREQNSRLTLALDEAMRIKPARHNFAIDRPGAAPALARHMSTTGG